MTTQSESNDSRNYLIVVAHPDDAELGCGGSIASWVKDGHKVSYVVCTSGNKGTKDVEMTPHRLADIREQEQKEAAERLKVDRVVFLRHQDGELESTMAFRNELALLIRSFEPNTIVTHDPWRRYLVHPDHRAVGMSTMDAVVSARDILFLPAQSAVGITAHTPSELLFTFPDEPDYIVDITDTMELKLESIARHQSQLGGASRWVCWVKDRAATIGKDNGYEYAESFKRVKLA
jgi:LmbE family N-acetylglucosaminyl deacetylase